jgi:hypothetical protein
MARKRRRKIKLVWRKLRRNQAFGMAYPDGRIEVDPRASARSLLSTIIHEATHVCWPEASETKVARSANAICRVIWEAGYRRIYK